MSDRDARRELRDILDREDRGLARSLKGLLDDFEADDNGEVTFSRRTFQRLEYVREAGRDTRRLLANVNGGGRARRRLLRAFDEFNEGMIAFAKAARSGFSVESAAAMRKAAAKAERSSKRIRAIHKGLPK